MGSELLDTDCCWNVRSRMIGIRRRRKALFGKLSGAYYTCICLGGLGGLGGCAKPGYWKIQSCRCVALEVRECTHLYPGTPCNFDRLVCRQFQKICRQSQKIHRESGLSRKQSLTWTIHSHRLGSSIPTLLSVGTTFSASRPPFIPLLVGWLMQARRK